MRDDYFSSNEFKQNLQLYEQGKGALLDSEILTDIADHYRAQGFMDKALGAADFALTLYPGATAPLVFKARAALAEEDVERAEALVDSIDDKTDLDYHYMKAELLIARRKEDEADAYLEAQMEEIDAQTKPDYVLDVATLFGDYDLMEWAEKWLSRSDETDLDDYKELWGRILVDKGETEEAVKLFEELVERDPFSPVYWNLLGTTQWMQQHYADAVASSEYALAIDPRSEEALMTKAGCLSMLGNFEEALTYYERYASITRCKDTAEMYVGVTLATLERNKECIPHLQAALEASDPASPNLPQIYNELVLALMKENRVEEAEQYVTEAEKSSCDPNEMKVLHGHILLMQGRVEEAQQYMYDAYMNSGMSAHIVMRVAISLNQNGYISLAYDMLEALLDDMDEQHTDGYGHLAACAYELGKNEAFLKYLKVAVERNPVEARFMLSDIFPPGMPTQEYYDYAKKHLT